MSRMKVHIIGGAGSGKSYLATRLAILYDLDVLHLDELFWDNSGGKYGVPRAAEERNRLLNEFLERDSWVIEGVFHTWLAVSFTSADVVAVLRPPLWLRHLRTVRRFIRRKLGLDPSHCRESLRSLADLVRWNNAYDGDNLARAREFLAELSVVPMEWRSADEALDAINVFK